MGEKMDTLTQNLEKMVKEQGLSPAQAVLKAGIGLDNESELLELVQETGIVDQSGSDSASLIQMTKQLVAGLDPNTKRSLASFLSEIIKESNVSSPPADVQQFITELVGQESPSKIREID